MIYSVAIILGFVRLSLMTLMLFYLNRKFINYNKPENFFDFVANQWFKYGSLLTIEIFVLVQLGIYNLFNTLLLLLFTVLVDYIGLKKIFKLATIGSKKIKTKTLELVKNIELEKPLSFYIQTRTESTIRKKRLGILALFGLLGTITFVSRYYLSNFDMYSMSTLWTEDLERVIYFDYQEWFGNGVEPVAELALINFYGKISNISPEIALESMGIIEAVLISLLIFWAVNKITSSRIIAPIVASLVFGTCYTIIPANIPYILQHNSMFMALSLALPAMVFYLNPTLLKFNQRNYFLNFLFAFVAIGLIDLFTMYVIVLPFILIGLFFSKREYNRYNILVIGAYCLSSLILFAIYGGACFYIGSNFEVFLHASLISASSYNYFSHLVLPYHVLMNYYMIASIIGIAITIAFTYLMKENWHEAFSFLILFIFIIFLGNVQNEWIDTDMIRQAIAIFIPIMFGILTAILIRIGYPIYKKAMFLRPYFGILCITGIIYGAFYFQQNKINSLTVTDKTPRKVLSAYEKITSEYFPLSYAVVNDYSAQSISTNQHFFINYEDFLDSYLKKDLVFYKYRKNKKFLQDNPYYVLPKSVLVFVYLKKTTTNNPLTENKTLTPELIKAIKVLKKRGRKINLLYKTDIFNVYEIVNNPNESQINDLIL